MILSVKNLNKRYGKKFVLKTVNIKFTNGINTLLGENGAGKTILLNVLSTVIQPTSPTQV